MDDYRLFQQRLREAKREFKSEYRDTHIDILEYVDDLNNKIYAGVNWGAWGTQLPEDTRIFAEALNVAADLCEQINAEFDIDSY